MRAGGCQSQKSAVWIELLVFVLPVARGGGTSRVHGRPRKHDFRIMSAGGSDIKLHIWWLLPHLRHRRTLTPNCPARCGLAERTQFFAVSEPIPDLNASHIGNAPIARAHRLAPFAA
jgi:hypothetical protein